MGTRRRLVGGVPAVYTTFMRPDAVHTSVVDGVAWMDMRLLAATLYSGSYIPGGGPYRYTAPIGPAAARTLVADSTPASRMQDANGGYFTQGKTIIPFALGQPPSSYTRTAPWPSEPGTVRWP